MRRSHTQTTLISLITLSLLTVSFAQTKTPPKRKKLKDFDSSLKRLKWNPEKNAAVELPANGQAVNADEDDVIRIDTSLVRIAKLQSVLAVVAALTGGWTEYLETPEQAEDIYARIFSDINQRYIVGYYPTNKERDGKRRKIEFAVKGHPEYQVYGRRSYFAPTP